MKKTTSLLLCTLLCCIFKVSAVTFNVTVPAGTQQCYIAGKFNNWSAGSALQMNPNGTNKFILDLPDVSETAVKDGFKYLSGPDWAFVEKNASGEEISNRTVATANDVVLKWASLYTPPVYVTENIRFDFPDGLESRKLYILTPPGYDENPTKHYPVIYLNGIRQRYHDGGEDNNGDDFFADRSWGLTATIDKMYSEGKEPGIVVAFYGYISEFSPWANDDFMGSGKADQFLNVFVDEIIPYINGKYRTLTDAEHTTIAGADMGGLISYYAALKYPNKFGKVALFSTSFWFNKTELQDYVNSWEKTGAQKIYFMTGGKEGAQMTNDVKLFYELTKAKGFADNKILFDKVESGLHDDISWGKQFNRVYSWLLNDNAVSGYRFMNHSAANVVICDENKAFEPSIFYPKGNTDESKEVMCFVNTIPADFKTTYYYNINKGTDCAGTNLLPSNQTIGFSSSKTAITWQRLIIHADESVNVINASKNHFRLVKGNGTEVIMTQTKADGSAGTDDTFTVSATVTFAGADETITVHYGSVNSGSKQDALFSPIAITDNCSKAQIIYCFKTNQLAINCIERSETEYRFMDGTTTTLTCHVADALENSVYFPKSANESTIAKVFIKEVPVNIKSTYYWNLNQSADCSGEKFFTSNKNVGFSSSKQYVSWIRVVVYDDLTSEDVATSSAYFRVVKEDSDENITMTQTKFDGTSGADNTYTVSAEVNFSGSNQAFEIYFGSVNSGSKQSALTPMKKVSDTCSKAQIIYCFKTNEVKIIEKEWNTGEEPQPNPTDPAVVSFSAVPSICKAGLPVTISTTVENMPGYTISYGIKHNYGSQTVYPATKNVKGEYEYTINAAVQGIYHIQLIANNGTGNLSNMPLISVKVPHSSAYENTLPEISANAYKDVNWNFTGKYKGNFHTHTAQSFDTGILSQDVIDRYRSKNYKILALTDHDINTFPWTMLDIFDETLINRDPEQLGMLTFSAIELSKDSRNSWDESTGGEFNHHNDFFTGRKGQEFLSLQESYAYTEKLGGMQIINHPGQYWKPEKTYNNANWEKNSPAWHARNFMTYESLVGLEVYNQGDRWTSDRVLWDDILTITMPERPVYGYSNDDSHNSTHYYRNYQFMLMDDLSIPSLKDAMKKGQTYFSYEPAGNGNAKAPQINKISVDNENATLTIDTPDQAVYWISGTDKNPSGGNAVSTVVGYGKTFHFAGFQGNYVRALIKNQYGETCTQPFGFAPKTETSITPEPFNKNAGLVIFPNPAKNQVFIQSDSELSSVEIINLSGQLVKRSKVDGVSCSVNLQDVSAGIYVIKVNGVEFVKSQVLSVVK